MKKISQILILALLTLTIQSCKKDIKSSDKDFIGTWENFTTTLIINADGSGSYDYYDGSLTKNINGKVKIKNGKLKVKFMGIGQSFKINQRPTQTDGGGFYMILDGDDFYRSADY